VPVGAVASGQQLLERQHDRMRAAVRGDDETDEGKLAVVVDEQNVCACHVPTVITYKVLTGVLPA
jgi:hypothetical protein